MSYLIAVLFVAVPVDKNLTLQSATFVIPHSYPYNQPILRRQTTTTTTELPVDFRHRNVQENQEVPKVCGYSAHKLIQGGQHVQPGEFPWLGALFLGNVQPPMYLCTVNLVTRKHLLTAAQCLQHSENPEHYHVALGYLMAKPYMTMEISAIAIHPQYNEQPQHDLAVLSLRKDLKFVGNLSPICLHFPAASRDTNLFGTVAGFGPDYSTYQKVRLPIVSQSDCRDTDNRYFRSLVNENTFCVGNKDQTGPCNGDSGAGYMQEVEGRYYLRGIVSASAHKNGICDLRNHYTIFTNLVNDMDWLNNMTIDYLS